MRIQGPTYVHHAHAVNSPHRAQTARGAEFRSASQTDQLDISSEAQFISRVHDLPEMRADRVASLRAQIQSGTYESEEKLHTAMERLLDEIG